MGSGIENRAHRKLPLVAVGEGIAVRVGRLDHDHDRLPRLDAYRLDGLDDRRLVGDPAATDDELYLDLGRKRTIGNGERHPMHLPLVGRRRSPPEHGIVRVERGAGWKGAFIAEVQCVAVLVRRLDSQLEHLADLEGLVAERLELWRMLGLGRHGPQLHGLAVEFLHVGDDESDEERPAGIPRGPGEAAFRLIEFRPVRHIAVYRESERIAVRIVGLEHDFQLLADLGFLVADLVQLRCAVAAVPLSR